MTFPEEYFIHIAGEQKGPYTFPQLKRLYENNLIPEETLYWRDGMEQLQPVAGLCGATKAERMRRIRRLRAISVGVAAGIVLAVGYCAPVLNDGWREMNDRDPTPEGAYWKARGFIRETIKAQDASVAFDSYLKAVVTLSGTRAAVTLPGTLFPNRGAATPMRWRVAMQYDAGRREWQLPAK